MVNCKLEDILHVLYYIRRYQILHYITTLKDLHDNIVLTCMLSQEMGKWRQKRDYEYGHYYNHMLFVFYNYMLLL